MSIPQKCKVWNEVEVYELNRDEAKDRLSNQNFEVCHSLEACERGEDRENRFEV